jgi:hypothetical protein
LQNLLDKGRKQNLRSKSGKYQQDMPIKRREEVRHENNKAGAEKKEEKERTRQASAPLEGE